MKLHASVGVWLPHLPGEGEAGNWGVEGATLPA